MLLTFWKRQNQKRKAHEPQKFEKTFLQDNCGKIIKKLLNHLAIIILRGITFALDLGLTK